METPNIRTCPHCGASVSGTTERCPNCDRRLQVDITPMVAPPKSDVPVLPIFNLPEAVATNPNMTPKAAEASSPVANEEGGDAIAEDEHPTTPKDTTADEAVVEPTPLNGLEIEAEARPLEDIVQDTPAAQGTRGHSPVALPYSDTPAENIPTALGDAPAKTQEAYLSAFVADAPISPAARVPEPEPLPPLATKPPTAKPSPPTATSVAATQSVVIPTAPFTPPPNQGIFMRPTPAPISAPPVTYGGYAGYPQAPTPYAPPQAMGYGGAPSDYWLQQRIKAYQLGNYKLEKQNAYEALLSRGKGLPFFWWLVAGLTLFGAFWYALIMFTSGFRRDKVYIGLEPEGYVFEEGAGAAHVRQRRYRSGRRWGVMGIVLLFLSVVFLLMLVGASALLVGQYEAEINAAYPELNLFAEDVDPAAAASSEVENARIMVLVMIVLGTLSVLGILGGFVLAVVSYMQAAAYRVNVPPLPGYD